MRRLVQIACAVTALLALAGQAARAEDLVSGLSQDQIEITSNYTGTDLVVFGAIETRNAPANATQPDVVVVVRGPNVDMTVRQKGRVAGLWINRHEVTLRDMPGYYYLASTRPLDKIANAGVRQRYQLGLSDLEPASYTVHSAIEARIYTNAAVRQQARDGLYKQVPTGVEFLSYSLFRVRVPVPAGVPRGQYTAEVYLFQQRQCRERAIDAAVCRPDRTGAPPLHLRPQLAFVLRHLDGADGADAGLSVVADLPPPLGRHGIDPRACPACRRGRRAETGASKTSS